MAATGAAETRGVRRERAGGTPASAPLPIVPTLPAHATLPTPAELVRPLQTPGGQGKAGRQEDAPGSQRPARIHPSCTLPPRKAPLEHLEASSSGQPSWPVLLQADLTELAACPALTQLHLLGRASFPLNCPPWKQSCLQADTSVTPAPRDGGTAIHAGPMALGLPLGLPIIHRCTTTSSGLWAPRLTPTDCRPLCWP